MQHRFIGASYIFAVLLWFALEGYAAVKYLPGYNYAAYMISDLGVDYEYSGHGHPVEISPLAWLMNFNFYATACLYAFLQWMLLLSTSGESTTDKHLRTARAVCCAFFMVGLILVGVVHGGPREHSDGTIIEHQIGATFAILGGNINNILAGVSPAQILPIRTTKAYQYASIAFGVIGLVAVLLLISVVPTIIPEREAGTVERWAVYTIFMWEMLTGLYLLLPQKEKVKIG